MNIIGFGLQKISGERKKDLPPAFAVNNNIEIISMESEDLPQLKGLTTLKVDFQFSVNYTNKEVEETKSKSKKEDNNLASIQFQGTIVLSLEPKQAKQIIKDYNDKTIGEEFKIPLFNLILKKCSLQAAKLEEELDLPIHFTIPQIRKN